MSDYTKYVIRASSLDDYEKQLNTLSKKVSNRRLVVDLSRSKGNIVKELEAMVSQLNEFSQALVRLIDSTQQAIACAKMKFIDVDMELGKKIDELGSER